MLVRAVHAALWSDAKNLSWKVLQAHAFSEVESYEMILEAYEGEDELKSKPDQHAKLRKMLGLDSLSNPEEKRQPDTLKDETSPERDTLRPVNPMKLRMM